MKYSISVLLAFMLSFGPMYAEGLSKSDKLPEFREVTRMDMNFDVELNDDNTVTASWDSFEGEGFDWYKLLYSTTNGAPVYPDDKVVFVGSIEDNQNTFKLGYGKNHYVRLCAITVEDNYQKGRYCTGVKKIETELNGAVKKYVAKKTAAKKYDGAVVKYDEQKQENTEKKQYVKKTTELTSQLKDRVDAMLKNFMTKLDSKGYSEEKKLAAIDGIMDRMETLKEKNPRYEKLVTYMMEQLELYAAEFDDGFSEIESIFEDF